jgi:hypothetical protein
MIAHHWYNKFFYVWTDRTGDSHFVIMPMGYIAVPVIVGAIIIGIVMRR